MMENVNPLDNLSKYNVVLASNSPRRRELLSMLDVDFEVRVPAEVDEHYPAAIAPSQVPEMLALRKAEAYLLSELRRQGDLVIASDTVVIADGHVLGKPADEGKARDMLRMLSGRTHTVVSGVAVSDGSRVVSFSASTRVTFAALTDDEIAWYVERYRPLDKAGAYGIQEWIGCIGVSGIEGSFYNVMGLPLHRLYTVLRDF